MCKFNKKKRNGGCGCKKAKEGRVACENVYVWASVFVCVMLVVRGAVDYDYGCVSPKRENTTSSLRAHVRERSMHGLCVYIPLCASLWACVCTQLPVVF